MVSDISDRYFITSGYNMVPKGYCKLANPRLIHAEHLSGDDAELLDKFDFIYSHMKNLKKKLAEAGSSDYIKTIYGLGYKFTT